jgi:hypothetical protein
MNDDVATASIESCIKLDITNSMRSIHSSVVGWSGSVIMLNILAIDERLAK